MTFRLPLACSLLVGALALATEARAQNIHGPADSFDALSSTFAQGSPPGAPRPPPPPLPSADALKALVSADPRAARPILRRAARTAPDAQRRALALAVLARRDPTRATARICSRALRTDADPSVRRAAAECLGRLSSDIGGAETPGLVAALEDPSLDVVTMAGWALANVGDRAALAAVTAQTGHGDPRVARLFYDYAVRLRARAGLPLEPTVADEEGPRLIPSADAVIPQRDSLQMAASSAWLALFGGMAGWLHGGLFLSSHGGAGFQQLSALTALGGAVAGATAAGTYGFLAARKLTLAHTVVQLGSFGTLAGYGAGLLSAQPPASGLNMASFGLVGTIVGTGLGAALVTVAEPAPGALALGLSTGMGAGFSFGALALGYGLEPTASLAVGMVTGGVAGGLTTLIAAPLEVGLLPITGATVGGLTVATTAGLVLSLVEGLQLASAPLPFTEGAGWAVAGGYAVGAALGGGLMLLVPPELDPLREGIRVMPPTVAFVGDRLRPGQTVPVALLSGVF